MAPQDRFVAETTLFVRYAETDAMGIVHHASYIVYFEEGRSHYSRARGADYAEFERSGYAFAVSEVHARYHAPAHYGERLTIRCWVEDLKSRSVVFGYEIVNADSGVMHVTGQTRHICIARDGTVATIPADWRARFAGAS